MTYIRQNEWKHLPKRGMGGFGEAIVGSDMDQLLVEQKLPESYARVGRYSPVVGRYAMVDPDLVMWETPVSPPMSVTGSDAGPWNGLGGFGEAPSTGEAVAVGVGSMLLWGLSIVFLGGVVIWVVRSVRKKD